MALAADEFDFPKYLGGVFLRSKAAIIILSIESSDNGILGNLVELLVIATIRAGYPIGRSWQVVWLHK